MNDQTHHDHADRLPDNYPLRDEIDPSLSGPSLVTMPGFVVHSTIETLGWLDEFLRCHASPAVHAELDAFCRAQGAGGAGSATFVIDAIGLGLHRLQHAWPANHHGQEQR
jgi:hypothetical protein